MRALQRPLRGALIGCGFFAQNHLQAWQQLEGVEIVALCDADPERLQRSAEAFGVTRTYAHAEDLFAKESLDFVDIATTVDSHAALVAQAAAAGVACICQKPFARTLAEGQAMVDACAQAGVPLMVHENFRWQTPLLAVRAALDAHAIGRPFWARISFRSAYDVFSGQPYLATEERFILQDLGIHLIDIARCLFGEAHSLSAATRRVNQAIRGEDVATLLIGHEQGVSCVIDCSYATALPDERFPQTLVEIDGSEGTLRLDADYRLTVHHRRQGTLMRRVEPPRHRWSQVPWHNIQDSVLNIQAHWLDCLRRGVEPQTSGQDNLRTLALVEAAYTRARQPQVLS